MPQLSRIILSVLCKKPSFLKTPSLGDFALDFDISYDCEGRVVFRRSLSELCNTVVAEMLHRYLEWASQLQLYYERSTILRRGWVSQPFVRTSVSSCQNRRLGVEMQISTYPPRRSGILPDLMPIHISKMSTEPSTQSDNC